MEEEAKEAVVEGGVSQAVKSPPTGTIDDGAATVFAEHSKKSPKQKKGKRKRRKKQKEPSDEERVEGTSMPKRSEEATTRKDEMSESVLQLTVASSKDGTSGGLKRSTSSKPTVDEGSATVKQNLTPVGATKASSERSTLDMLSQRNDEGSLARVAAKSKEGTGDVESAPIVKEGVGYGSPARVAAKSKEGTGDVESAPTAKEDVGYRTETPKRKGIGNMHVANETPVEGVGRSNDSGEANRVEPRSNASSPQNSQKFKEHWSQAKLKFYVGKYTDLALFFRKGYKPRKKVRQMITTCNFWNEDWTKASDVSNTNRTSEHFSNLRSAVGTVSLAGKRYIDVAKCIYELYDKDFVWRLVRDRKLTQAFPMNVMFENEAFFHIDRAVKTKSSVSESGILQLSCEEVVEETEDEDSPSVQVEEAQSVEGSSLDFPLKSDVKFLLQIGEDEHLSVRNSKYGVSNGGLGLFAENHFYAGGVVTFHLGPVVWAGNVEGGPFRTQEYLRSKLKDRCKSTERIVPTRDLKGRCVVMMPKMLEKDEVLKQGEQFPHLFLGAHYINDPTCMAKPGTFEWDKESKRANVRLMEDGSIVAKREILRDDEIFMIYSQGVDFAYEGEFDQEESLDIIDEADGEGNDERSVIVVEPPKRPYRKGVAVPRTIIDRRGLRDVIVGSQTSRSRPAKLRADKEMHFQASMNELSTRDFNNINSIRKKCDDQFIIALLNNDEEMVKKRCTQAEYKWYGKIKGKLVREDILRLFATDRFVRGKRKVALDSPDADEEDEVGRARGKRKAVLDSPDADGEDEVGRARGKRKVASDSPDDDEEEVGSDGEREDGLDEAKDGKPAAMKDNEVVNDNGDGNEDDELASVDLNRILPEMQGEDGEASKQTKVKEGKEKAASEAKQRHLASRSSSSSSDSSSSTSSSSSSSSASFGSLPSKVSIVKKRRVEGNEGNPSMTKKSKK